MSLSGLVSRVTPVQTALRNCAGDEGRPFGFGDQVADPKPPQAAAVKSRGGERCGNAGTMIPTGKVRAPVLPMNTREPGGLTLSVLPTTGLSSKCRQKRPDAALPSTCCLPSRSHVAPHWVVVLEARN